MSEVLYYNTRTLAQLDKHRLSARGAARHSPRAFIRMVQPYFRVRSGRAVALPSVAWEHRLELRAARAKGASTPLAPPLPMTPGQGGQGRSLALVP